jgi:hypothetical protein
VAISSGTGEALRDLRGTMPMTPGATPGRRHEGAVAEHPGGLSRRTAWRGSALIAAPQIEAPERWQPPGVAQVAGVEIDRHVRAVGRTVDPRPQPETDLGECKRRSILAV